MCVTAISELDLSSRHGVLQVTPNAKWTEYEPDLGKAPVVPIRGSGPMAVN